MNVLSVIHYPFFGGPQNRNRRVMPKLQELGVETVILLPDQPGVAAGILRNSGITVETTSLHRLRALKTENIIANLQLILKFSSEIQAIRKIIRIRAIDVVLINGLVNPHSAIAAKLEKKPVVWQILDTAPPMWLRKLSMILVKKFADVVMSTGMDVAKEHPGALDFGNRLIPFFPPVDTQAFQFNQEKRSQARAMLGVPDDAFLVGTVGNLTYQKGHEFLIRAASLIKDKMPNAYVRILGGHMSSQEAYEASLTAEAVQLGLMESGFLDFHNPGQQVSDFLPAFDLFVLSSRRRSEGIPTAILEAMSCGIPVIASQVGSVHEAVADGLTGLVVEPENPQALADAIIKLWQAPDLRRQMSETARQIAIQQYDVSVCAGTHLKAFEKAISHLNSKRPHG